MHTPVRSLRRFVACALLASLAACGGSSNTTSVNLGGNVTGLTEVGLILSNGISSVALAANVSTFTFPSRVLIGSNYQVVVQALPPSLICTVTNGTGFAGDKNDINNVQVTCVSRNSLGGTITGLTAPNLRLANGSDTVSPPAGAQSFTFPGKIGQGFSYGVTVVNQPTGQTCTVPNPSGVMGSTNITSLQVICQ